MNHAEDPVQAVRQAVWDLPVSEEFIASVLRGGHRRRARSPWWVAGGVAAALVVIVASVFVVLATHTGQVAGPAATVSPTSGRQTSPTGSTPSSISSQGAVTLVGWTFVLPAGWTLEPEESYSVARYGKQGLLNDGQPLGPGDMAVTLRSRVLDGPDYARIFVTVLEPHPTNEHPGPRPAPDRNDPAAAVRTIVDAEKARSAGTATPVQNLAVGEATLIPFDDRNGQLYVVARDAPAELLLLQCGRCSPEQLVDLAKTLNR